MALFTSSYQQMLESFGKESNQKNSRYKITSDLEENNILYKPFILLLWGTTGRFLE